MKKLAILTGKIVGKLGSWMGRGSSLPGKLAGKIDPSILSKFTTPVTIMVTGTNGKTSTSHFISQILTKKGRVVHNAQGANMPQGIGTVLLNASDLSGRIKADYLVLEVDEGFLKYISQEIKPDYLVTTNISQDQVDRFSSLKMVEDLIGEGIKEDTVLVANGNDPSLVNLARTRSNETIFYGLNLEEGSAEFACPSCGKSLEYSKGYYGNIGEFSCSCGLESPKVDYLGENIDLESGSFEVAGFTYRTPYHIDYIFYNLMAAISLARTLGVEESIIASALEDFEIGEGRMETISFGGRETIFNLVKNPEGLSRTLDFISKSDEPYNIYLAINKRPADGQDLGWLANVDFSIVNPRNLVVEGEASYEAKEILRNMGLEISDKNIKDLEVSPYKTYFLSNYTAMAKLKDQLGLVK